jgi:homocysteine S-methyltransferase
MTNVPEALGVVRASQAVGLPVAISFTVETDGSLPTGQSLRDAIRTVDAETGAAPAYYMINCAHPVHFAHVLERHGGWAARIRGIRANASTASHAELDAAPALDAGDPDDLGARYAAILQQFPHINVLGGCCGTDDRHVARICDAVLAQA